MRLAAIALLAFVIGESGNRGIGESPFIGPSGYRAIGSSSVNEQQLASTITAPTAATTPTTCLKAVRDFVSERTRALATAPDRLAAARQNQVDRLAMARDCAKRFDPVTTSIGELLPLLDLYGEANQPERAKVALERGLAMATAPESDRAGFLLQAVRLGLLEPKGDERNAKLESYVDALDKLSDAVFDAKFGVHQSMNGYYRADDIDAGIIKHSTWLIEAGTKFAPDQRLKYLPTIISAHINMAEAWAGQGMNDRALALLESAKRVAASSPDMITRSIEPVVARYKLVGTVGASIAAPRWINGPRSGNEVSMKGGVTLLEFTAHWCGPCKESYPGINRLRQQFGKQGFRVVLATRYWGYFGTDRNLTPEVELARDREYFADHHLDVPVAVNDEIKPVMTAGRNVYPVDPNDANYKVGGIPQIHLIDKQGRIRLIMVGYDDANEQMLSTMIEKLLKEK